MPQKKYLKRLVLSALFLCMGLILPFFTGQIPQVGRMLLPMHIPVLLCGLICSAPYGLAVGFILPLLRSLLFTFPLLYPDAVSMAFELAAYGGLVGFLYGHARWQCIRSLYRCLLLSMLAGRAIWGLCRWLLLGLYNTAFSWEMFVTGALTSALPGIVLQLVLIPSLMLALDRTKLVPFRKTAVEECAYGSR